MNDFLSSAEEPILELTAEEKARVEEIKKQIDSGDPNSIIQYGVGIQNNISEFADKILAEVKAKDTGRIGSILSGLMFKMKELDIESLSEKNSGLLSKIPFIYTLVDKTKKFMARYQSLSVQIVKIIDELEKARIQLMRDIEMLESFYDKNIGYYKDISLYILAGEIKLKELQDDVLPEIKAGAEASGDPVDAQKYNDMSQFAARLSKKYHDLKLSRAVALQAGPQIRLVQNNNRELAEKIQSSVLNTIPLWKNQLVIAITLLRQRQAVELQQHVSETTRELLERNSEMLKAGSIDIAEEAEKGIVDIDTLKKVNADLINTIEETIRLQREGKSKRELAAQELIKIEYELKEKLLDIRNSVKK